MDLVKKSIGLGKTIKNVTRFREIISVFTRNGLDEFVIKSGLHKVVPNFVLPKTRLSKAMEEVEGASWAKIVGYRLRVSFEELGPGFIKIGQLLSTREDIFPKDFIDQMKLLRDRAKGIEFKEVLNVIELTTGRAWDETYEEIQEEPIGTASIGVAYKAKLKTGEYVVLKVRRPGIKKIITTDIEIAQFIVNQVEKVSEDLKYFGASRVVRDFGLSLQTELDFNLEALNAKRLKENLEIIDPDGLFHIPKIYTEYSTESILVMEFLDGIPFSDSAQVKDRLDEIQQKLVQGIHIFIKTLLKDGFFHADLHGGNFFLLKNGKIGLIDFGLMGNLSKKGRTSLIVILYSLLNHNYENLVYEFLEVAEYEQIPDIDELIRDVRESLSSFVGLTVQQMNLTLLLNRTISTLSRHKIYLPREWFIVSRALITLDGVGKSLNMDLEIFEMIGENLGDVAKQVISKEEVIEEALLASRDIISALRVVPRHLRWFLKSLAKNDFAIQIRHTGHEKPIGELRDAIVFFGHAFISGLLLVAGVLLMPEKSLGTFYFISKLTWVAWILALGLFIKGYRLLKH